MEQPNNGTLYEVGAYFIFLIQAFHPNALVSLLSAKLSSAVKLLLRHMGHCLSMQPCIPRMGKMVLMCVLMLNIVFVLYLYRIVLLQRVTFLISFKNIQNRVTEFNLNEMQYNSVQYNHKHFIFNIEHNSH